MKQNNILEEEKKNNLKLFYFETFKLKPCVDVDSLLFSFSLSHSLSLSLSLSNNNSSPL